MIYLYLDNRIDLGNQKIPKVKSYQFKPIVDMAEHEALSSSDFSGFLMFSFFIDYGRLPKFDPFNNLELKRGVQCFFANFFLTAPDQEGNGSEIINKDSYSYIPSLKTNLNSFLSIFLGKRKKLVFVKL